MELPQTSDDQISCVIKNEPLIARAVLEISKTNSASTEDLFTKYLMSYEVFRFLLLFLFVYQNYMSKTCIELTIKQVH